MALPLHFECPQLKRQEKQCIRELEERKEKVKGIEEPRRISMSRGNRKG
jgi:hypothetical protein